MSAGVGISAAAVEVIATNLPHHARTNAGMRAMNEAAATLRALRAALDAAERERDEADARGDDWHDQASKFRHERDAAATTHYARGVRDAANTAHAFVMAYDNADPGSRGDIRNLRNAIEIQILALLPENKETNDV